MKVPKLARALSAVGVAGLAMVSFAGLANAAPGDPIPDEGKITVHKYENPTAATGLANNGTEIPAASLTGLTPIEDVKFVFNKVDGIDLSTNAGWQAAAAFIAAGTPAASAYTEESDCTTLANRTCDSGILDAGLYYVVEESAPTSVTKGAPFFVTIPMTNPTGTSTWMSDIHVYPKNVKTDVTKTPVDDNAVKVGDSVPFEITGVIPSGGVSFYGFTDKLDTKLTYSPIGTKMEIVPAGGGTAITLTGGTDHKITAAAGLVSAYLTPAGLLEADANAGGTLKFTINTTVNTVGEISNTAQVFPNQPWSGWDPSDPEGGTVTPPDPETCDPDIEDCGVPTGPVQTKFGGITVKKTDSVDASKTLAAAEFKVYATNSTTFSSANEVTTAACGAAVCVTASGTGEVVINNLRYSKFVGGEDITATDPGYRYYWLVETKAPAGYELLAEPVGFEVTAQAATVEIPVKNVEANGGGELPVTGGNGIFLYIGAGLLIIGGAAVGLSRMRRLEAK